MILRKDSDSINKRQIPEKKSFSFYDVGQFSACHTFDKNDMIKSPCGFYFYSYSHPIP